MLGMNTKYSKHIIKALERKVEDSVNNIVKYYKVRIKTKNDKMLIKFYADEDAKEGRDKLEKKFGRMLECFITIEELGSEWWAIAIPIEWVYDEIYLEKDFVLE